jgi:murein DD-endopeptidase MepM/ murein hydrolase activator NlpD
LDTKKITVLIIGNDDKEVKSFKINANLINNYKKYLIRASAFTLFTFIIAALLVINSIRVSLNNTSLTSTINTMNQKLETYDSLRLQQKINSIDNNLSMIDSYLQNRGMLEMGNAGGERGSDRVDTHIEMINRFEKQSVVFYQRLKDLPLGYPYDGVRSSDYGYRRNPFGGLSSEFHAGVDLKGAVGDPIYATGDGTVERCDFYGGYGNAVVLNHRSGFQSLYGHLSAVNVVQGQQVKAGDVIGFLGSTGRSTGPHLHYEIRKDGEDISPEPFLKIY